MVGELDMESSRDSCSVLVKQSNNGLIIGIGRTWEVIEELIFIASGLGRFVRVGARLEFNPSFKIEHPVSDDATTFDVAWPPANDPPPLQRAR